MGELTIERVALVMNIIPCQGLDLDGRIYRLSIV